MAARKSPFFDTATTLGKIVSFFGVSAVCGVLVAGMLVPAAAVAGSGASAGIEFFEALPAELEKEPLSVPSRVLAKDGSTLATFYAENRIPVTLDEISEPMQDAIVAIEDERFWEHNGVDIRGIARAAVHNLTSSTTQGASTLTQQYVNNMLINADFLNGVSKDEITYSGTKNIGDKLREAKLAISVEKQMSKEEILQGYLNIVLFSGTTYGVEAAAQRYFSTSAAELTAPQAAMLAGMVQRPNAFNPLTNPELTLERRNTVLAAMKRTGAITAAEYEKYVETDLGLNPKEVKSGCVAAPTAQYFCSYVQHLIMADPAFGETPEDRERLLYRGGLTIQTTLDPRLQKEAEKETAAMIPADDPSDLGSSIVSVEPGTGRILAMAQNKKFSPQEGTPYTVYNFNVSRAMGGVGGYQTGSTMKPFTTLAWLQAGRNMWDMVDASRASYPDSYRWKASCLKGGTTRTYTEDGQWEVGNSIDNMRKPMTVDYGLYWSVNTATVAEAAQLDLCQIAANANNLGLVSGIDGEPQSPANPSFVLGTTTVTPLAQAAAFAAFANDGEFCAPRALVSVKDSEGNEYQVPEQDCQQVVEPEHVRNLNGTLSRIADERIAKGTIDMPIAGKTGTNNGASSTWFVGYTTGVSTAAWVGRGSQETEPIFGETINGQYYEYADSMTFAGPMWTNYAQDVLKYYPAEDFGQPDSRPSQAPPPAQESEPSSGASPTASAQQDAAAEAGRQAQAAPAERDAEAAEESREAREEAAEESAEATTNDGGGNRGRGNGSSDERPGGPGSGGGDN